MAEPIGLLLAVAAFTALVAAWRREPGGDRSRLRALLALWYVLPAALLTVLPVSSYVHYFIVLLPLPFFGIAAAAEMLVVLRRLAGVAVVSTCLAYFAAIDGGLFRTVLQHGGAPGDYGTAYRFKATVVHDLIRIDGGARPSIGAADENARGSEYRFLVWNALRGIATTPVATGTRYIVYDSLAGASPGPDARIVLRKGPLAVARAAG
ncbi:MAG: hypothetical protein ACXVQ3_04870 [Gaiellaceae bacterium]